MGMSINEAGEEQAASDVYHPGLAAVQLSSHLNDFFSVNAHVGPVHTAAGDHSAAFEKCLHRDTSILPAGAGKVCTGHFLWTV